jgi:hypothetical protein
MPQICIEPFDPERHPNPMAAVDDTRRGRHERAPNQVPYWVCSVTVKGFTFVFHSLEQIRVCLDYYRREHRTSSRLPLSKQRFAGDHWEVQRWYERLPAKLLEKKVRPRVVVALEQAMKEYSQLPGAATGVDQKPYLETW